MTDARRGVAECGDDADDERGRARDEENARIRRAKRAPRKIYWALGIPLLSALVRSQVAGGLLSYFGDLGGCLLFPLLILNIYTCGQVKCLGAEVW